MLTLIAFVSNLDRLFPCFFVMLLGLIGMVGGLTAKSFRAAKLTGEKSEPMPPAFAVRFFVFVISAAAFGAGLYCLLRGNLVR